ncbi:TIGR00266 family protein [Ruminococcaceae bacterium OttesenSCG-928-I18]|nr:TIGR00266 family protein [Ruminococcaceae bacterium OttesenSCG-928-I18]
MEYNIIGEPMPVVECQLNPGEAMKTEKGSMTWCSPNMAMSTNAGGGIGKMFGRVLGGESIFQNIYTCEGGPGMIAFGSSFTGSIRAYTLTPGKSIICQKSAFLASEMGVEIEIYFQKKFSTGLFGGEGFVMQKLTGNGTVFVEIDGYAVEYDLAPGQSMLVSTGNLALMEDTCTMELEEIKGVKNWLFGGESVFDTKVTGPGKIILQTMTVAGFAAVLAPFFEKGNK